jgi:pimeloyl-ACP methyl ester carboxylesterase
MDLDVRIDGRRLEAIEIPGRPSKRPLVLLHEGLGSVGLWRTFPRALHEATHRRVVAFSRLGHGRSDPPPAPRTPAFFHEEALDVLPSVLRQVDIENPVLVGHSEGASIALIYAGAHAASGLVLIAPLVVVEDVTLAAIRETHDRFERGGLRERLARHHDDPDTAFRGWCDVWLAPSFRGWTLEDDAARVDCPVLLVQGADDPYGTLDQVERIEANVGGPARRFVVSGGHSPHLEAPETVLREVVRFLDEVDREHGQRPAART